MRTLIKTNIYLGIAAFLFFFVGAFSSYAIEGANESRSKTIMKTKPEGYASATLAGGCFWCLESELRSLDGVLYTRSGYTGGESKSPNYEQISTGKTGHAEAVELIFDPAKITYKEIINFFLTKAHDPTQLNRQGVDIGTQYRSAIYYHDEEQRKIAEYLIRKVDAQELYKDKIVTEIASKETFWEAEEYHQQYYEKYEDIFGKIHPRVYFKQMAKEKSSAR